MLLTKKKLIDNLEPNSVVSFVGYANFRRIPVSVLNEIYWYVDGVTLTNVFRALNIYVEKQSFDFTGLAEFIFLWCKKNNYTIHFIGGSENESRIFLKKIKAKHQTLKISCQNGYDSLEGFDFNDLAGLDVCVYGLGAPLQEKLAIRNKNLFKYSFTCGAFITQTSKSEKNYYPNFYIKNNLRWLYRVFKEKGHFIRLFVAFLYMPKIYVKAKKIIDKNNYR